jgi:hypothetical protein
MDRFSHVALAAGLLRVRKSGPSRPTFDIADDRRETEPSPLSTRRLENTASSAWSTRYGRSFKRRRAY